MVDMTLQCPVPLTHAETVMLAHGGGGRMMRSLIEGVIMPAFSNPALNAAHDGAALTINGSRLAFTTDSYVVQPLFFPGGDIGTLAVNGTVNDLAMCGARPLAISAGFIIEEGFSMDTLRRVIDSMAASAREAGVQIVTGDTKVVDQGKGDGLYINTAGIGMIADGVDIAPTNIRPGDVILLNGDLGRHSLAIMALREGLSFESEIESDCAPLVEPVMTLLDAGIRVRCLRDLTRGGLASALVEIATTAHRDIQIAEAVVPMRDDVRGACEILGLDPLYAANEGRFIAFVAPEDAMRALALIGDGARMIGSVQDTDEGIVTLTSVIGASRIMDMLSGEQLPRIC